MSAADSLAQVLPAQAPGPVLVGYSGGLDSTVLLHLLAQHPDYRQAGLRALHVDHGLHPDASRWRAHCRSLCETWGITLEMREVTVHRDRGLGLEGAARLARHAAFESVLHAGEWLALAQHRDDQAETFLLRALRASGSEGLAGMAAQRALGAGQLWRPLLDVPRSTLRGYAQAHGLSWIEDPSNDDDAHDRNFLRRHVLPLLRQRWPHADAALARSATLSGEASALLAAHDDELLDAAVDGSGDSLDLATLQSQAPAQRARMLRRWVAQRGHRPLPASGVAAIEGELLFGDDGACFAWAGSEIRRWRSQLHLRRPWPAWPAGWQCHWDGRAPLALPDGGSLVLIGAEAFDVPLIVRHRGGGERLRLPGHAQSHSLKHLLQQAGIAPWQRIAMPLLWDGHGQLQSAGDCLLSAAMAAWLQAHGAHLQWQPPRS
ncbi:MAG TPA: tRNA lysidine(34) synthetase TilS [Stenotrophomonas sp.]|jgi:tRNA(Ile)-lysidine synthase